ncbi:MAG: amino acid permease, partial [Vulcanisaeta sp. AZ3]
MSEKQGIFVRESTGLVKEAGFWDAVSINMANMSIGAALGTVGFTLAALPTVAGANLVYASLIATLFGIPQVIVYSILIRYIPRVGGDYIWLGRALGPRLAWLVNGLVLGFIIESLAYYALISLAAVFQLESILPILGITVSISTPEMVGIAIVFFAFIVLTNVLGTRYGIKLMTTLTTISLLGLVIAIATLLIVPKTQVISAVSSLLPSGYTYANIAQSYKGPYTSMSTILMLLPFFAIYVYPWLNASPAIASEIRGRQAINWNIPLAFLVTSILMTLGFGVLYYSLGFGFVTMALSNPDVNGFVNFWSVAM